MNNIIKIIVFVICYLIVGVLFIWRMLNIGFLDTTNLILLSCLIGLSLFPLASELKIGSILSIKRELKEQGKDITELKNSITINQQTNVAPTAKAEVVLNIDKIVKTIKELNGTSDESTLKSHAQAAYESLYGEAEAKDRFYRTCYLIQDKLLTLGVLKGLTMRGQNVWVLSKEMEETGKINERLYQAIRKIENTMSAPASDPDDYTQITDLSIAVLGALELELEFLMRDIQGKREGNND